MKHKNESQKSLSFPMHAKNVDVRNESFENERTFRVYKHRFECSDHLFSDYNPMLLCHDFAVSLTKRHKIMIETNIQHQGNIHLRI